jgi:phosphate-selective porin OprO/OprP
MNQKTILAAAMLGVAATVAAQPAKADEKELRAQIEQQRKEIEDLKRTVNDLVGIVNQRVTKLETQQESGKVLPAVLPAKIESPKSDFSLQVVGALQPTAAFYSQSNPGPRALPLNNGINMRRAQLGVQGTVFRDFSYAAVFDMSATGGVASSVKDATIAYTGFAPFTITIGNQKPQNGMEASFSDRSSAQVFLEPAMSTDLATALSTRYLGARISTGGPHYSASFGVFGDDINNNGISVPNKTGWGFSGRVTYAPIAETNKAVHLGVSALWRKVSIGRATAAADPLVPQLRFRSRPEVTVDGQRLVDTGNLANADNWRFFGAEFATLFGPFSWQSEYTRVWVDQGPARVGLSFDGGYGEASYFLTGGMRTYDPKTGVFTRARVSSPLNFDKGTWGAWEIAARVSYMDLNDKANQIALGGIHGGYEINYTGALNWYWNNYFRLQLNFIHANVRNGGGATSRKTDANIIGIRAHQEW